MPSAIMSQKNGDVLVVYFTESRILDEATIQTLGADLEQMANRAEEGKLLLNFENVRFMSSAMLGKLVSLNKKCKTEEIDLKLCSISKDIMEVFKLMRLNKLLDLRSDEDKALSAFAKKGFFR
jgi:anti-sigma B factor antagonist|tara:strand:- start:884 stop:1252 length:369 start_codon:yes stop_codon:yes gene_type:complete